jgi:hypothetical protein
VAYFHAWLAAFLFTEMVEVPIYWSGLRVGVLPAFGASAITHPLLWFVFFPSAPLPYVWKIVVGEALVLVIEAGYFALAFHRKRAFLWSVIANGASFGIGMLSRWLFGFP